LLTLRKPTLPDRPHSPPDLSTPPKLVFDADKYIHNAQEEYLTYKMNVFARKKATKVEAVQMPTSSSKRITSPNHSYSKSKVSFLPPVERSQSLLPSVEKSVSQPFQQLSYLNKPSGMHLTKSLRHSKQHRLLNRHLSPSTNLPTTLSALKQAALHQLYTKAPSTIAAPTAGSSHREDSFNPGLFDRFQSPHPADTVIEESRSTRGGGSKVGGGGSSGRSRVDTVKMEPSKITIDREKEFQTRKRQCLDNVYKWCSRAKKMNKSLWQVIEEGILPKHQKQTNESLRLFLKVSTDEIDTVGLMLSINPSLIYSLDVLGRSVLHRAAARESLQMVKLLLLKFPDIDCQDMLGLKAIDIAVQKNNYAIAKELFLKGASPFDLAKESIEKADDVLKGLIKRVKNAWASYFYAKVFLSLNKCRGHHDDDDTSDGHDSSMHHHKLQNNGDTPWANVENFI